jgi:hypothetical protein
MDSYRCFKLVNADTKSQVTSDTVEFRHSYLSVLAPSIEDRIIHGLQVVASAITGAAPPTSISQVEAITNLRDIFESWRLLAPPSFQPPRIPMPGRPRVPTPHEPPRVVSPSPPTPARQMVASPSWSPPPRPLGSTCLSPSPVQAPFQATPQRLDFTGTPSPRVGFSPQMPSPIPPLRLPAREPVAHRTRSRAPAPAPLALFTAGRPLHECVTYQMPTAKAMRAPVKPIGFAGLCRAMPATEVSGFAGLCQALSLLEMPEALSVLDSSTGEFLEHRQLRRDPRYKATWDTSYANELGRLCQGIGSGTTPNSK